MIRSIYLFAVILSVLCFSVGAQSAEDAGTSDWDWPCWGGPNRDWTSAEDRWRIEWLQAGLPLLWKAEVGTGFSTVSAYRGACYTLGNRRGVDTLYCFDSESGNEIWNFSYRCDLFDREHDGGPACAPTLADGRVFVLSREADLYCLEASTGEPIWSTKLSKALGVYPPFYGFTSSPLVEGETVIVDVGVIACFRADSGDSIWKTEDFGGGNSTPTPFECNGTRYGAFFNSYGLVALNLETKDELFRHRWETKFNTNIVSPIFRENKIFVSSGYEKGCALLDIGSGKEPNILYENKNMRNQFHSCVYHEGFLYGFDGDYRKNGLRCLNWDTGEVVWTENSFQDGSLLLVDGKLLILTGKGEAILARPSPDGLDEISRAHLLGGKCWTAPTLSNGRLYVRNSKGTVACFDLREEKGRMDE